MYDFRQFKTMRSFGKDILHGMTIPNLAFADGVHLKNLTENFEKSKKPKGN